MVPRNVATHIRVISRTWMLCQGKYFILSRTHYNHDNDKIEDARCRRKPVSTCNEAERARSRLCHTSQYDWSQITTTCSMRLLQDVLGGPLLSINSHKASCVENVLVDFLKFQLLSMPKPRGCQPHSQELTLCL
jgi:hypothetical protein